jgi:predicted GIY-YIG superfamily endonuclease
MIGIYSITNLANGKRYIGQSVDLELRLRKHRERLVSNRHGNKHLQGAYNQYGKDAFVFEIIAECAVDQLDSLECGYIEHFNTMDKRYGYNQQTGGHNNHKASDELRERLSKAHKGLFPSLETRLKQAAARLGKKRSPEVRRRMSESRKGIVFSEEHRKNLANARKGKPLGPHSEETKRKIAQSLMGHPPTQKTGWKHTPEAKKKMSDARKLFLQGKLERKQDHE